MNSPPARGGVARSDGVVGVMHGSFILLRTPNEAADESRSNVRLPGVLRTIDL